MPEPRRINFPVLVDPASREECLILFQRPIEDARSSIGISPTQCFVIGFSPASGQHREFSVPIVDYQRAVRAPVHFIECDSIRAPGGTIVDAVGQPFDRPKLS